LFVLVNIAKAKHLYVNKKNVNVKLSISIALKSMLWISKKLF